MGLLKFILFLLLGYYALKLVARWFAPKVFAYAARKTGEHFQGKFQEHQNGNKRNEERVGDIIIDRSKVSPRRATKKVGEYIEFEEVD